jgi:hypothetical protein
MRLEGWEFRLDKVIEAARARKYEIGRHDCFRVACQVLEALTGRDRWPEFDGRYSSSREALRLIAQYGSTFEAAFDWFFGSHVEVRRARRGDIVAVKGEDGQKHLGVCLGVNSAFLAPQGLVYVPTLTGLCAWRI